MSEVPILAYEQKAPFDRWVTDNNPGRLPFIRPLTDKDEHPEGTTIRPGWKLCLSAVVRDGTGAPKFPYWHEHNLWAGSKDEALEAARQLLQRRPGLLELP